ncbi:MAG: hypothetical protein AAB885_03945 [Patescibacteria group bacterium]
MFKFPKDTKEYHWTSHIKNKMLFYRISEQKIKTILKSYDRKEEGVAQNTMAVMKRNDTPKRQEEIWLMYQNRVAPRLRSGNKKLLVPKSIEGLPYSKIILISAWRYPGKSKPGKQIPIPDDILQEIKDVWFA